jgi:hypothetical protein
VLAGAAGGVCPRGVALDAALVAFDPRLGRAAPRALGRAGALARGGGLGDDGEGKDGEREEREEREEG